MDVTNTIKDKLGELIGRWCVAENNRRMYGYDMPQARHSRENLTQAVADVFLLLNEFSLVKKEDDLEIIADAFTLSAATLRPKGLVKVIRDSFAKLNINSVTLRRGMSDSELSILLSALNLQPEDLKNRGGLQKLLKQGNVRNIEIDQLRFMLVHDDEEVVAGGGGGGGGSGKPGIGTAAPETAEEGIEIGPEGAAKTPGLGEKPDGAGAIDRKAFALFWKDYISGSIQEKPKSAQYHELIEAAQQHPRELLQVLKRVVRKQKDIEAYLSNLGQKLADLGFSPETIHDIKQQLTEPQKVLVAKNELERLHKLEEDFQMTLEERVENSLREIKQFNQKLIDEKERINTLLRQNSQGVIVIDDGGKIISINPLAEKTLGISLQEGKQKPLKDLIKQGRALSLTADWQKETEDHTPKEVETIAPDSTARDIISESSAVIEDKNGKAIGTVSALQNMMKEEELKKMRTDIMEVVGHDLRAPILVAKQNLSVLLEGTDLLGRLDETQKKFITTCQKNIEKMEKLISAILDIRQLETGKIVLRKEEVFLDKILEESVNLLRGWADNKKIRLRINMGKIPAVVGDPERISQVIINLLSNALKFTPEQGSVTITATSLPDTQPAQVRVSAMDTGIGIKDADLKRIFNKYEQVSLKSPRGESGLGLGLAICKTIIELHGGTIGVESKEGEGSTFSFILPAMPQSPASQ